MFQYYHYNKIICLYPTECGPDPQLCFLIRKIGFAQMEEKADTKMFYCLQNQTKVSSHVLF